MEYDVREDETQIIKMQEISELLVAAGYFRARIKGLNNFDKIVGGMSWAIEMSNVDLDVDILFHDSLIIGQKIALTEKIVNVLQIMNCPHKIEPHQIQGMDCIHIFPVIQWLVKKSIETRQQMGDYIKAYANWQFNRSHNLDIVNEASSLKYIVKISKKPVQNDQTLPEDHRKRQTDLENSEEYLLRRKVESAKHELLKLAENEPELREKINTVKDRIEAVKEKQKLFQSNQTENDEEIEDKKRLCHIFETLRKQKIEFKHYCREEKSRLEKQIEDLVNQTDNETDNEADSELHAFDEKHSKLKLHLASTNKEYAKLSRKFDDIPSRAELSQYQKRFIELYNQVAAKHNETKKFYTLYNTLDDERMYLEKELNLLNSILENFKQAQTSHNNREQFLNQFEQIVDSIKQTKQKVETRRQTEKMKRDQLNEQYLELIEKQRLYYKAVKDFKEECRKNEILSAKIQDKTHNNSRNKYKNDSD